MSDKSDKVTKQNKQPTASPAAVRVSATPSTDLAIPAGPEDTVYVVNRFGTVHSCTRKHAELRLRLPGWRMATADEIAAYCEPGSVQSFDRPFGTPWKPAVDNA